MKNLIKKTFLACYLPAPHYLCLRRKLDDEYHNAWVIQFQIKK
jgi:hypothetical protein